MTASAMPVDGVLHSDKRETSIYAMLLQLFIRDSVLHRLTGA